ncbi:hypothetical protein CYMTET_20244 [Cymbomonas tetramitiformis]|uniref:Uncharacterized protein n=1 Tax=Cymbomonas tetramitiformis TaxID=36881 RepID=A0AAE0G4W7_9CHLO|nr:hypothetical protein CYMTET_20244 [Cymbomonas tetramitiformis]
MNVQILNHGHGTSGRFPMIFAVSKIDDEHEVQGVAKTLWGNSDGFKAARQSLQIGLLTVFQHHTPFDPWGSAYLRPGFTTPPMLHQQRSTTSRQSDTLGRFQHFLPDPQLAPVARTMMLGLN